MYIPRLSVAVIVVAACALWVAEVASAIGQSPVQQDKPQAGGSAPALVIINGVWQVNATASSTSADLSGMGQDARAGSGSGSRGGGSRGGGGRGGRGGFGGRSGGGSALSPEESQKLRALVREVTQMPPRLTVNLTATDVTLTYDSGQVFRYAITGKEEKHDFTNGSVKTKTTWDGAVLTQHLDLGNNIKLVETCAVSGDQLVVSFTHDTGTTGATGRAASPNRPALDRRWVYDAVK
jgi:hypothetical protein